MEGHSIGKVGVEDVMRFQHTRVLKGLFKSFLTIVEGLELEHDDSMSKLYDALPQEYKSYVDLIDFWTENRSIAIRKQILDSGNDAIRQLDEQLANFEISIKESKGKIL